jgi:hypothetical protein
MLFEVFHYTAVLDWDMASLAGTESALAYSGDSKLPLVPKLHN